jgi:RNA polymerase sigma-70 factor (ECF subfamily)
VAYGERGLGVWAVTAQATDAEILAAANEDPHAFALLYDRYAEQLYMYTRRRVGPDVAQDLVANTFLAAFRARGRYDPRRADARTWLYSILSKEIGSYYRKESARYRLYRRIRVDPMGEDPADRVGEAVTAAAARAPLAAALAGLSGRDRDVLLLVAWGDLTYDEVAQALAIPVGTVRSRLNRARRKVRAVLADKDVRGMP